MNDSHREQQMKQAEDILGDRLDMVSFAKGLFFGQFHHERLLPYPDLHKNSTVTELVRRVEQFCRTSIDPVAIDRQAEIPASVVRGLGELGVLGACLPNYCGGLGLGQVDYCRLLEVLGGWCGSTALFVNAHHSIGPRAVVLFGTQDQQQRWLPKLATGESLSAFALTEPEAGSDAANVQTTATPTEDGSGYLLNGQKRWITNGGIAQVLTVMARTPAENETTKITAFLVTPDMPGFEVVEKRMEKCGVRGTATSRLAFHNMFVPKENVLGQLGKGLRIALTVLDYGRTTFGASCTGAAKFCIQRAAHHANTRVQFDETLGSFELVKEKLAFMQAGAFAMEACTYQTAALMDSGEGDFMLETAMLKVFTTETLWRIINDTFQIHGGKAYFTDEPFERMLRDARINTIGEGANDVLRVFSAAVGMRDVGLHLESVLEAIKYPLGNFGRLGRFIGHKIGSILAPPEVPVRSTELEPEAVRLAKTIAKFGRQVEWLLRVHQREIVDRQYLLGRIADAAIDLYASACVINRLDFLLRDSHLDDVTQRFQLATGRHFLQTAERRIRNNLRGLRDNDDQATTDLANRVLKMA
jgi:alkylation response protein AidB-like acyl-CoA dehydrogenase